MSRAPKKVLAVSSGGGHWVQLARVLPALEGHRLFVVTTDASRRGEVACERFFVVRDASRWNKLGLLFTALGLSWILLRVRPRVVLSTGAAPGFLALLLAKAFGARTLWIDSIANAERLSLSGEKAGRVADLWLTQWAHLARPDGPHYRGSVL
jgi:UDP-N-acetylglucosamine:LPS N-acetylglucosamine transferase